MDTAGSAYDTLRRDLRLLLELSGGPRLRDLHLLGGRLQPAAAFSTGTISNVLTGQRPRIDWTFVDTFVAACHAYARQHRIPVVDADYDQQRWNTHWRACTRAWRDAHPGAGKDHRYDPGPRPGALAPPAPLGPRPAPGAGTCAHPAAERAGAIPPQHPGGDPADDTSETAGPSRHLIKLARAYAMAASSSSTEDAAMRMSQRAGTANRCRTPLTGLRGPR